MKLTTKWCKSGVKLNSHLKSQACNWLHENLHEQLTRVKNMARIANMLPFSCMEAHRASGFGSGKAV